MPPTVLAGEVLRAAAAGDAREVKKLLKRNAPVVFPALIAGVQGGHADVVALLAASPDINVNACLANGCSPLFTSAAKGDDAVMRVLLTNGALVDQRSASGATSLFIACQSGAVAVAETLLASGADAVLADGAGATPLYVACQNGHAAAVELLLCQREPAAVGLNVAKNTGATPLYVASQKGHAACAAALLTAHADVDKSTANGASPLLIAALQACPPLRPCPNPNPNPNPILAPPPPHGPRHHQRQRRPVCVVPVQGHAELVEALLAAGADPNGTTPNGKDSCVEIPARLC